MVANAEKKQKKQKIMSSYDWRSELDYVDEAYGGRGVSRKAKLASIHPPTAEAAKKNIPTETDRGSGNKAKKRMKSKGNVEITQEKLIEFLQIDSD